MFFGASSEKRGIYLREPEETKRPVHGFAIIEAAFPKRVDNREKLAYEARFRIESTVPWVRTGQSVFVANGHNSGFEVVVDPTQLESGVHWAEIRGFEEGHQDLGPAFRLPVTVTRPVSISAENPGRWSEEMSLKPGTLERRFIEVPSGVSWLELRIRAASYAVDRLVATNCCRCPRGKGQSLRRDSYSFVVGRRRRLGFRLCPGALWKSWSATGNVTIGKTSGWQSALSFAE